MHKAVATRSREAGAGLINSLIRSLLAGTLLSALTLTAAGCKRAETSTEETAAPSNQLHQDLADGGTIAGQVMFDGAAPKPQPIDVSQDPGCLMNKGPHESETFVVNDGKLANVLVYVKGVSVARDGSSASSPLVIDQKGCRYIPHVAAMWAGGEAEFTNSDPAMHNIHAPTFNESQMPGGKPVIRQFNDAAIMMPIQCNQHPWMKMYLNVVPSPFFAVTNADGSFEIPGLPAGEYTLAAVHERMGEKDMRIKIAAKQTAAAEFRYSAAEAK